MSTSKHRQSLAAFVVLALIATVGFAGSQGAHAQTPTDQLYASPATNSTLNTNGATSATGTTNSSGTMNGTNSGTVTGSGTPGVPNTGAGGDLAMNITLLVAASIVAVGGLTYLARSVSLFS